MTVQMLKGKIHRATVKQAELNYVGSITVDADLLDAAGIYEYEKVAIVDIENGSRFETYTIAGERGSGMICLNGAAARCVSVGDKVILMAYAQLTPEEVRNGSQRIDTKVCPSATKPCSHAVRGLDEYYPLGTPVSFYLMVWRRPETGDRFEKRNGKGFFLP